MSETVEKHEMKVNLPDVLREVNSQMKSFPITIGLQMVLSRFRKIAVRACEINDQQILHELERMGLVVKCEEASPLVQYKPVEQP